MLENYHSDLQPEGSHKQAMYCYFVSVYIYIRTYPYMPYTVCATWAQLFKGPLNEGSSSGNFFQKGGSR